MMFRKILTLVRRLIFFGVPIVLLLLGVILWNTAFLFESIEPEEASPFRILLWICVRDQEKQSPATVERLLDRLEKTIGRSSGEMPQLRSNSIVDKVAWKLTTKELERRRKDIGEYTLFASATDPTDAAKKNDEILAGKPLAERNIFYLFKCRYIREMDRYDAATSESEKQAILQNFVDDLKWWNRFSEDVYRMCQVSPPSLVEMAKEYEMAFEYYRKNTESETYRRMVAFRDKLQVAFVVSETKSRVNQFFGPLFGK